ncbi:MAG: hypothetical protein ACK5K7_04855 [Bacilli bacterium]
MKYVFRVFNGIYIDSKNQLSVIVKVFLMCIAILYLVEKDIVDGKFLLNIINGNNELTRSLGILFVTFGLLALVIIHMLSTFLREECGFAWKTALISVYVGILLLDIILFIYIWILMFIILRGIKFLVRYQAGKEYNRRCTVFKLENKDNLHDSRWVSDEINIIRKQVEAEYGVDVVMRNLGYYK